MWKLFEYGRDTLKNTMENAETAKVGIHKTVRVGSSSINFDVGKP